MLRTAVRVLVPIASFQARNAEEFYMGVKRIRWDAHMANTDTFLIKCNLNARWADNSQYLALKAKDAIVDRFRERTGRRPSVYLHEPTLRIHIHE